MKRGIVVAGGSVSAEFPELLKACGPEVVSIGVDRGIAVFLKADMEADYYLGDLDSIDPEDIPSIPAERLQKFPAEKNASDLELALELCVDLGLSLVEVYGATGTRWDHSFSNLLMLKRF